MYHACCCLLPPAIHHSRCVRVAFLTTLHATDGRGAIYKSTLYVKKKTDYVTSFFFLRRVRLHSLLVFLTSPLLAFYMNASQTI